MSTIAEREREREREKERGGREERQESRWCAEAARISGIRAGLFQRNSAEKEKEVGQRNGRT